MIYKTDKWEIMSLKGDISGSIYRKLREGVYRINKIDTSFSICLSYKTSLCNIGCSIHSILRRSDNKLFTLGDTLLLSEGRYKINIIELVGENIVLKVRYSDTGYTPTVLLHNAFKIENQEDKIIMKIDKKSKEEVRSARGLKLGDSIYCIDGNSTGISKLEYYGGNIVVNGSIAFNPESNESTTRLHFINEISVIPKLIENLKNNLKDKAKRIIVLEDSIKADNIRIKKLELKLK